MSFVEQATLRILDEASPKIARINSELTKLFANKKSVNVGFNVNMAGLDRARTGIHDLFRQLNRLRQVSATPHVNVAGLASATAAANAFASAMSRAASASNSAAAAAQRLAAIRPPTVPPGMGGRGGPGTPGGYARGPFGSRGYLGTFYQHQQWQGANRLHGVATSAGEGLLQGSTQRTLTDIDSGYRADAIAEGARLGTKDWRSSTKADLTEQLRQIAGQVDTEGEVVKMGPMVGKLNAVSSVNRGNSRQGSADALEIIRGLDSIGRADNAVKFGSATDAVIRGQLVAGKNFNANTYSAVLRNAGRAKYAMDDQALTDLAIFTDENKQRAGDMVRQGLGDLSRPNLSEGLRGLRREETTGVMHRRLVAPIELGLDGSLMEHEGYGRGSDTPLDRGAGRPDQDGEGCPRADA